MNIKEISRYVNYASYGLVVLTLIAAPTNFWHPLTILSVLCSIASYGLSTLSKKVHRDLLLASENNDIELVHGSLKYQADIEIRCKNEISACELNKENSKDACNCGGATALIRAARFGNEEIVNLLLEHGADVHALDNFGDTALAWAGFNGNIAIVETLLGHGAWVDSANKNGDTVLIETVRRGQTEIVKLLIAHDAQIDQANNYGNTPLMFAIHADDLESIKLLLSAKADCDAHNQDGDNPLIYAASKGMNEVAKLLLECGAYVNHATHANRVTALLFAARIGNLELVKLLAAHHAEINARCFEGYTPLMVAAQQGNEPMVRFLLDCNADTTIRNKDAKSALDLAVNESIRSLIMDRNLVVNVRYENNLFEESLKFRNQKQ